MGRALRLRVAVVRDVHLAADDRLHSLLARSLVEVDRTREGAVVRERDRRHLEPRRLVDERGDPARPVEDRELGVDVEVNERRAHREGHRTAPAGRCPFAPIVT